MADFTGQNIQDTYQRVVQIDNGQLQDGTGSALVLLDVTASHAISASHEITFELSSSHAETADFLTPGNDINVRHITASGDISQSGNFDIFTGRDVSVGRHFVADGNITSRAGFIKADSYISGSEFRTTGNITASGNISASGNNHAFGGLTFIGDTTNEALGNSMLTVAKGTGVNIKLYSTHAGTNRDVGFHMSASSNGQEYSIGLARERNTFYIAPSSVQLGPENAVFEIDAIGNITASGDISSSGTITGIINGGTF